VLAWQREIPRKVERAIHAGGKGRGASRRQGRDDSAACCLLLYERNRRVIEEYMINNARVACTLLSCSVNMHVIEGSSAHGPDKLHDKRSVWDTLPKG
jgi:hypothetical protein